MSRSICSTCYNCSTISLSCDGTGLAERLQMSQRSVYRDIETLKGAGAEIEAAAGFGVSAHGGFLLPSHHH